MSALGERLREMIASDGPMPVEQFMMLALSHPRLGYYMTRDPLGAAGDFTTSPEISQMFGELLGLWAAETWMQMGSPASVHLVELGPGRGTLMADALRAARVCPPFLDALSVHLVETSPALMERQHATLSNAGVPTEWHAEIDHVPPGPAIFLANEFFDALPVRQYLRTEQGWCERLVGLDAERRLAFGIAPAPEEQLTTPAPVGAMLEIGAIGYRITMKIAARIRRDGGAALFIDYGHTRTSFGETLQAMAKHQRVDPLAEPGEADLTTHVDFDALRRAARATGAHIAGPITQAEFLKNLGIGQRAASLAKQASPQQAQDIAAALKRLTSTEPEQGLGEQPAPGMGELFQAMAILHPALAGSPGFPPSHGAQI